MPDIQVKRGFTDDDLENKVQGQVEELGQKDGLDPRDVDIDLLGASTDFEKSDQDADESESENEDAGSELELPVGKAVPRSGATSLTLSLSESASRPHHGTRILYILSSCW